MVQLRLTKSFGTAEPFMGGARNASLTSPGAAILQRGMEDIATLRMVACWAEEAVKAYEAGDERHVVRCYALMFAAVATAKGKPAELLKRGLDKGQRDSWS